MKTHRVYGLTDDELARLKARAGGACEMCCTTEPLAIDHCHATDRVRGLLCASCNTRLRHHEDGTVSNAQAASYLASCPPMLGSGRYHVTPIRKVRVPDEVWQAAKARAEAEGTDVSAVVRHALRRYGEGATNNVMPPPRSTQPAGGR